MDTDAVRLIGGLRAVVETTRPWDAGEFLLRGSVDVERIFSGAETLALVSRETLCSEAPSNRILLGVDSLYRRGRYSVGGKVTFGMAPGSCTRDFSGRVRFEIRFQKTILQLAQHPRRLGGIAEGVRQPDRDDLLSQAAHAFRTCSFNTCPLWLLPMGVSPADCAGRYGRLGRPRILPGQ